MSGEDPRPAPRYGEYATPEEVAAALGRPAPPDPAQRLELRLPPPGATARPGPAAPAATGVARGDVIATLVLLFLGLWNTITAVPMLLELDRALAAYVEAAPDAPALAFGPATRVVGQLLLVLWAMILAVTAWQSWRRLRAGRIAFWVPLLGGAAALVAAMIATTVMFAVDPVIAASLRPAS